MYNDVAVSFIPFIILVKKPHQIDFDFNVYFYRKILMKY